jgi:hypothetical protein
MKSMRRILNVARMVLLAGMMLFSCTQNENVFVEIAHPVLSIGSSGQLSFGASLEIMTFTIRNNGTGILTWNLTSNKPWLFITPTSRVLGTAESIAVTVTVNRKNIATGEYFDTITIISDWGNASINTQMIVTNDPPPNIFVDPKNKTVSAGASATFDVSASGMALQYQWQKNNQNISGAISSEYTTPPVTISDNGSRFRCVVSNIAGSDTSNNAVLTVSSDTWLSYDNDHFVNGITLPSSGWLWVRFTKPPGWKSTNITKVMVNVYSEGGYKFDIDGFNSYLFQNKVYLPTGASTTLASSVSQPVGWSTHPVNETFTSDQFFIALYITTAQKPHFSYDTASGEMNVTGYKSSTGNVCYKKNILGLRVCVIDGGEKTENPEQDLNVKLPAETKKKETWLSPSANIIR